MITIKWNIKIFSVLSFHYNLYLHRAKSDCHSLAFLLSEASQIMITLLHGPTFKIFLPHH